MTRNGDCIYLAYRTDRWHTTSSRELIYVGATKGDCLAQLTSYEDCTGEQAAQLLCNGQSQTGKWDHEWELEQVTVGTFQVEPSRKVA